jgi:hypothetical protein
MTPSIDRVPVMDIFRILTESTLALLQSKLLFVDFLVDAFGSRFAS